MNMKINIKQYLTNITVEDILSKNVVECCDNENRQTILVRNSEENSKGVAFENEFFIMKNNFILEVEDREIGNFHILICKKNDSNNKEHFNRVCNYLFKKNNMPQSADEMLKLFYSLETIFSSKTKRDVSLEIGFYGELSVINYLYQLNLPIYKMWHSNFFNKHDMEINEKTKIEIKTTVKDIRKHQFNYDQLCRNKLNIYVISCALKTCEKGLSLYELCKNTMALLKDAKQILAIELLVTRLGLSEEYQGINCIPDETYSSIKIYNGQDIPVLCNTVPECISNVHYDVDFSNLKESSFEELRRIQCH